MGVSYPGCVSPVPNGSLLGMSPYFLHASGVTLLEDVACVAQGSRHRLWIPLASGCALDIFLHQHLERLHLSKNQPATGVSGDSPPQAKTDGQEDLQTEEERTSGLSMRPLQSLTASDSCASCFELDLPRHYSRRFLRLEAPDSIVTSRSAATHLACPVWDRRSRSIFLVQYNPLRQSHETRKIFLSLQVQPLNEKLRDRLIHNLGYRLQVANCLLSHGYLSAHDRSCRNDMLYLSQVINSLSHRHCEEDSRTACVQSVTIPLFVRLQKDETAEGGVQVSLSENDLSQKLLEFLNWSLSSTTMRTIAKSIAGKTLLSADSVDAYLQKKLKERIATFEDLPTWASHVWEGEDAIRLDSPTAASSDSSDDNERKEILDLPTPTPVASQTEARRKSEYLRPWAAGVRWAPDDSGWIYTILTANDEIAHETVFLKDHDGNVEKAYVEAARAHRSNFSIAADTLSLTVPQTKNVKWIGNLLSWRLENPKGTYRFFPVERCGVFAAWTRAVAAGQAGRKRQRCIPEPKDVVASLQVDEKKKKPTRPTVVRRNVGSSRVEAQPPAKQLCRRNSEDLFEERAPTTHDTTCKTSTDGGIEQAFLIDRDRTSVISDLGLESRLEGATVVDHDTPQVVRPKSTKNTPDSDHHKGTSTRPSVASTRASAASGNSLPNTDLLQSEAISLLPYPSGIIWARTTQRWFAIYKEESTLKQGVKRKKFKTFDPKKFDGNCELAFRAAVGFLEDKDPWHTRRPDATTTAQTHDGGIDTGAASFPIGDE